jgi:hypothetical protein
VEIAAIAGKIGTVVGHHVPHAGLVRIEAGEQARPRRATARGVVELREAEAVGGECVECGRVDLAAVAAEIGEAHVVGEDDDDVGLLGRGRGSGGQGSDQREKETDHVTLTSRIDDSPSRKGSPSIKLRDSRRFPPVRGRAS